MPDGDRINAPKSRKRTRRQKRGASAEPRFDVPAYLMPRSLAELRELAELMAAAGWAPEGYRDLDGSYLREKIEMAILHGAAVGLGPVAAAQSIALIEGMPTIWGDGALALVERSGLLEDMREEYVTDEAEGLTAVCSMRRRGRPTPIVNRFSLAMAEQARLTVKEGPWQTYPQRMLKMRARSWTIRDGFADVLRGLHIREEVEDYARDAVAASLRAGLRAGAAPRSRRGIGDLPPSLDGATGGRLLADGIAAAAVQPTSKRDGVQTGEPPIDATARVAAVAELGMSDAAADDEGEATANGAVLAAARRGSAGPVYPLVDADGVVSEHSDLTGLKEAFERLFCEPGLLPEQVVGLWQWNQPARYVIEARFGVEALAPLRERLRQVEAAQASPVAPAGAAVPSEQHTQPRPVEESATEATVAPACAAVPSEQRTEPHPVAESTTEAGDLQTEAVAGRPSAFGQRPRRSSGLSRSPADAAETYPASSIGAQSGVGKRPHRSLAASTSLAIEIDPGWGDRKLFQRYRARLVGLHRDGETTAMLEFRTANSTLETRLRERLPELIGEIDAIYQHAEAGGC